MPCHMLTNMQGLNGQKLYNSGGRGLTQSTEKENKKSMYDWSDETIWIVAYIKLRDHILQSRG